MIEKAISRFDISGTFVKAERFGSGLINDTYLCEFREGRATRKYILQRINTSVFRLPDQVMENVEVVTTHIVKRLQAQGMTDPYGITPALISTRSRKSYHVDGSGSYWRMFHFIQSGSVFDTVTGEKQAHEVGRGLGKFQALVADLPPQRLHDTLPGFHHTTLYLKEYDDAVEKDVKKRLKGLPAEAAFIARRRSLAPLLTDLMSSKQIPLRVVHNDPKVNNIMVHTVTGEALCMLDLDTVKPGIVHFDFGDCVRSAANPAGEDAEDSESVKLDLSLFKAITHGYLSEARTFITKKEIDLLPASVKIITFELGLRFLADYLRGDTYFKIKYLGHNLHRARVQFRLLESIEANEETMASIVKGFIEGQK